MDKETLDLAIRIGVVKYFNIMNFKLSVFSGKTQSEDILLSMIKDTLRWAKEDMLEEKISENDPDLKHILSRINKERLNG